MNPEQISGLISAFGGLLGAVLWPLIVVILALRFGPALMRKFADSDNVTIKAAGLEASFQKRQIEMAAALGAAATTKNDGSSVDGAVDARDIANDVDRAVPDAVAFAQLKKSVVLWVDDRPQNNLYERRAMEAMGVRVELALTTAEAVKRAEHRSMDLIISDMGRPGDPQAGYTLLDQLRQSGNQTPFLIYAGSRSPERVREARARGALGCTNSPQELILMVAEALGVHSDRTRQSTF